MIYKLKNYFSRAAHVDTESLLQTSAERQRGRAESNSKLLDKQECVCVSVCLSVCLCDDAVLGNKRAFYVPHKRYRAPQLHRGLVGIHFISPDSQGNVTLHNATEI